MTDNEKSKALDKVYGYVMDGVPGISEGINDLVRDYTSHYSGEKAINEFVKNQKIKCGTTGFLTGLGGLITLPITLPADLVSELYIEMRMIAGIALIRGYDIKSDQVKTCVYLCMVGDSAKQILKQFGVDFVQQITLKTLLPKISNELIRKINTAVGMKLLSKGGSKSLIKLSKCVPILGGVVGAGFNVAAVSSVAKVAKSMFSTGN